MIHNLISHLLKEGERMKLTTKEVADEMNISIQLVRNLAKKNKLPFAIVIENEKNCSYYFDKERFDLFKAGKL